MTVYSVTHIIQNYGSVLQAFALQNKIKEQGVDTRFILLDGQNRSSNKGKIGKVKKIIKGVFAKLKPEENYSSYRKIKLYLQRKKFAQKESKIDRFIKEHLDVRTFDSIEAIGPTIKEDDVLLAGSDQIWSMVKGDIRPLFTFEWPGLPEGVQKMSYAASIGKTELTEMQKERYAGFLKDFQTVSFREAQALEILGPRLNNNVRCDVDPTMLYDASFWDQYVSKRIIDEPYIFVYMLRPDKKVIKIAREAAEAKHCRVIYTGLMADRFHKVDTICDAGIEDFLSYIKYAEAVITNSFHGTVFSVLFRKQFLSVKINTTSSRVENLLEKLELTQRYIENSQGVGMMSEPIDYNRVMGLLEKERSESLAYIREICGKGH